MTLSQSGFHIIGLSQKDERCYDRGAAYKYQSVHLVVVRSLNGFDLSGGFEFSGTTN
jgi:hypothetical protein